MSSDALLMNVFCAPGVTEAVAVRRMLGVDEENSPSFGWKARVPLKNGRLIAPRSTCDGTACWLRPSSRKETFRWARRGWLKGIGTSMRCLIESYCLAWCCGPEKANGSRVAEEFTQEFEDVGGRRDGGARVPGWDRGAGAGSGAGGGWIRSYQLIRNVLAAYAEGCSFCVVHDARRLDLREACFKLRRR